jgi:hypothetical protein
MKDKIALHEIEKITGLISRMKVPGGWLYIMEVHPTNEDCASAISISFVPET